MTQAKRALIAANETSTAEPRRGLAHDGSRALSFRPDIEGLRAVAMVVDWSSAGGAHHPGNRDTCAPRRWRRAGWAVSASHWPTSSTLLSEVPGPGN